MTKQELKDKIDDIADAQQTISQCVSALIGHIDELERMIPKPPEPEAPKTQWLYRFDGGHWLLTHGTCASESEARRMLQIPKGSDAEVKRFTQE